MIDVEMEGMPLPSSGIPQAIKIKADSGFEGIIYVNRNTKIRNLKTVFFFIVY